MEHISRGARVQGTWQVPNPRCAGMCTQVWQVGHLSFWQAEKELLQFSVMALKALSSIAQPSQTLQS